jgi:hypothetical protein
MGETVPESPLACHSVGTTRSRFTHPNDASACEKDNNNNNNDDNTDDNTDDVIDEDGVIHPVQNVSPSEFSSLDRKRRKMNSPVTKRVDRSPATSSVVENQNIMKGTKGGNHKKKKLTKQQDKEDMLWICAECKEADCVLVTKQQQMIFVNNSNECSNNGDPTKFAPEESFLICDGGCHRIFHVPCAGLAKVPETEDIWLCKDCTRKEHACAFCTEYGKDNIDVFQCQDSLCGLFFHESCLQTHRVDYIYDKDDGKVISAPPSVSEEDDIETEVAKIPVFTCPAHQCWTCTQKDMIQLEKEEEAAERRTNGNNSSKKNKGKKKKQSIFQSKAGRLFVSMEMSSLRCNNPFICMFCTTNTFLSRKCRSNVYIVRPHIT